MLEKDHSFGNFCRLFFDLVYTKIFFKTARIVRYPLFIKGKKYLKFGNDLTTGRNCRIDLIKIKNQDPPILRIGENVQINDYVHICAMNSISIGNDVLIASHVYISDNSHGSYKGNELDSNPLIPPIQRNYPTSPVVIGDRVWIGEGVIIMPGVNIGDGTVIGAHAIINSNIPENCIAVGAPARIVKRYNPSSGRWEKTNPDGSFILK